MIWNGLVRTVVITCIVLTETGLTATLRAKWICP